MVGRYARKVQECLFENFRNEFGAAEENEQPDKAFNEKKQEPGQT